MFSALGYESQEVAIGGRASVNVILEQAAVNLEGVVIVGYGAQTRAVISGSVSAISTEEISRNSSTTSADALVGKIQGINTRMPSSTMSQNTREAADGRPGGATTLQIRNMGVPLFVIDGVPVTPQDFNQLNTADIEAISILKDASASVYGFRASNGVVLVTTQTRRIFTPRGLALTEAANTVFREEVKAGDKAGVPVRDAAPSDVPWRRTITPSSVMLFRYSAITFNPHRIHYDKPYCMEVEGYPGLVVHGPFAQQCLFDLLRDSMPRTASRVSSLGHV